MKIIVVRACTCVRYFLLIILALVLIAAFLILASTQAAVGVFSSDRGLPIYSVAHTEKVAAITFDCA